MIDSAERGSLELRTSSEVYDDAITAIRSAGSPLGLAHSFASDMRSIPHTPLPMNPGVAEEAVNLYVKHGGRSRLSYFDAFHVATAKSYGLRFLTSDRFVLRNAAALGVVVSDLSSHK